MKAWQLITHTPTSPTYRRLKSRLSPAEHDLVGSFRPTDQVFLAWERTAEIAAAVNARVVLFQCPASFRPDQENLANFRAFFADIKRGDALLAWEPRGDWPPALVEKLCRDFDLIHCVDPFESKSFHGTPAYWRLHGKGGYRYRYSDGELAELQSMLRRTLEQDRTPVYILFNNVWMKQDATRFQQLFATDRFGTAD